MPDPVNHPPHYTSHPSGVECIQVTEHADFLLGNAIKYIWRVAWGNKGNPAEDLRKAIWYLERAIRQRGSTMAAEGKFAAAIEEVHGLVLNSPAQLKGRLSDNPDEYVKKVMELAARLAQ
jgi:hypothetical protein